MTAPEGVTKEGNMNIVYTYGLNTWRSTANPNPYFAKALSWLDNDVLLTDHILI